jgi:hypothetical protein
MNGGCTSHCRRSTMSGEKACADASERPLIEKRYPPYRPNIAAVHGQQKRTINERQPPGRFDRSDVDLSHLHHRLESALGRRAIRIGDRGSEGAWRDLPRQTPLVLAPAACAFLAALSDKRIHKRSVSAWSSVATWKETKQELDDQSMQTPPGGLIQPGGYVDRLAETSPDAC